MRLSLFLVGMLALVALTDEPGWAADPTGRCGYYINSSGQQVPRPCGDWHQDAPPSGATAKCNDGTWSWSQHPSAPGTCSHHGGVSSYR